MKHAEIVPGDDLDTGLNNKSRILMFCLNKILSVKL